MGSKPKKSEYKPSAAEKASASVAKAENDYFKRTYDPLLQKMRDESLDDRVDETLRGRANADTLQGLAGKASYDRASSGAGGGDLAQAYQAQLAQADEAASDIRNKKQLNVLGIARDQAADSQSGMAAAANMGASEVLTKAAAKQKVREAKTGALGQMSTALIMQGAKNMKSKGNKDKLNTAGDKYIDETTNEYATEEVSGGFFSPVDKSGNSITGFKDRLRSTNSFGYDNNPFGN